jgi:MFS family permease
MALQPTLGRVYTFFNSKWMYMIALLIFEVGSVTSATAPSSIVFILGRAMAGTGAAAVFGGGLAVVQQTVPLKRRPKYLGLIASMFGVSSLVGPTVGGVIIDSWLTWRFCFWINLRMCLYFP